jgi:hypothetical protein
VLAVFDYPTSPTRFVIPLNVMSRDMTSTPARLLGRSAGRAGFEVVATDDPRLQTVEYR